MKNTEPCLCLQKIPLLNRTVEIQALSQKKVCSFDTAMKVVHLIFSFSVGGSETMLVDILSCQSKVHETHLVIINDIVSSDLLATVNSRTFTHRINRTPGSRNPWPILKLNLLLYRIRPDVIHMHDALAITTILIILPERTKKYLTVHDVNKPCSALSRYDKIFSISAAVRDDLSTRCRVDSIIVENGIDLKIIKKNNQGWNSKDLIHIVQISRLCHKKKGQHLLLEAVAYLRKETKQEIKVTFIGNGESKSHLEELAQGLGILEACHFVGLWDRTRIYQNLHTFDLLVQPSLYEGFGLTVIEGMAAGIPVIVSDGGGPAEIIQNGRYGWLFKNGDSTDLAKKLLSLLTQENNQYVSEKVESAYQYVKNKFDISHTANRYLEEYL
jgi:glycosyltransferase involved in cell wall biosynthesis